MVYDIRYVFIPAGQTLPYEGTTCVYGLSAAAALASSGLKEVPGLVVITGVFPANPTTFPT